MARGPQRDHAGAVLNFATVAVYADLYIPQPLLPLLSHEFRVTPATAGLTISAAVLMIAVVSSAWGLLSDRVGRKPVMVLSCALLAVPTVLCAVAPSFFTLLLCRALQGCLMPGVTAIAVAYLGDLWTGPELSPKVGGWIAASVTGGLTGRVLSGLVADRLGWRAPFILFGLLTLLGAAAMARALPPTPDPSGVGRVTSSGPRAALRHFGNRRLVGAFLIGGSVFFSFIGIFTYLPYYLTAPPFGLSTAFVSSVYLVYVAGVLTSVVTGRLGSRLGGRLLMAAGLSIAGIATLGTTIRALPAIIVSLLILCVGMFTVQSTAPAFVNANAEGGKGTAGALYVTFYYVGATLGSVLPGHAFQAWGWAGVVGSCLAALLLGLLADALLCA